ncbi:MAG: ATP-binding cassette domain-containing protein [Thermodesulfobacteriota bacterium]|nr:ATP-binding cassette domain-containing protein [Thermodesulfobacteriota bacterium]
MLSINKLNIQYEKKHLFRDVSVRVHPRDRIGLVGVNGAGKSTLLKIMAGIIETDQGVVTKAKLIKTGYLPQEIASVVSGRTLYKEAETAFVEILSLKSELDEINSRLGDVDPDSPEFPGLLKRQGELQHLVDQTDIFRIRSQVEKVLTGLGFKESDFDRECRTFSGGWLMRLLLAKHLLARPSLLLLDEPTNHLDIESLTWLEEFLESYYGSMVIISHDRAFLDNLTTATWELSLGRLTVYKGNYSKYVEEKEIRLQVQRAAYANQQAMIQQTTRFVQRFRAKSTKAKQVQSRVKQLEKMDLIEIEDTEKKISFKFPPSAPCGRLAVEITRLSKEYGVLKVFKDITFELNRGDKMAVVGVNGAGKSTFVRLLAGLIKPTDGKIRLGHNVKLSYFGQHQAQDLDPGFTVLETMNMADADKTVTQVRSLLGAFLFQGDDVDKKVMVLSGGEKSRLALAKMIASPANLLVMDEPTNHLDMISQEILQHALAQYDGSIIVVSHNRYFLDSFVNKVVEIKDGRATLFEGNLSYYLYRKGKTVSLKEEQNLQKNISKENKNLLRSKGKDARQALAKIRQEKSRRLKPFQDTVRKAENKIESLEERKAELEHIMADPDLYSDKEAFAERSREYAAIQRRLERNYRKWEDGQAGVEKIEAEFRQANHQQH